MGLQFGFQNKFHSSSPAPAVLLQRKCACEGNREADEEQAGPLQRAVLGPQSLPAGGGGHDFGRIAVGAGGRSVDGPQDEASMESVNLAMPPVSSPSSLQSAPQATPQCPTGVRVDTTTDLTQAGLQAGFLSGYGIIARMRVLPDRTTWDGTQVIEHVDQLSSTCPAGLTNPGPCNGNSTFTVGAASGGSALIPVQPAMRNRFYDYHTSRSRSVSFLHDATRNPTGMNACETVCQQYYTCNGMPLGLHNITRRFRKATYNGHDVTAIDVTKTDQVSEPGDFPTRTLPRGEEYAARESAPSGAAA